MTTTLDKIKRNDLGRDEFLEKLTLAKMGNSQALNELVVYFSPLIYSVAWNLRKRGVCVYYPFSDLVQEGNVGLLDAIGKCKNTDNLAHFVNYAKLRIHGQMMDAVRSNSFSFRSVSSGCKIYHETVSILEQKLKRPPLFSELKESMPDKFKKTFDEIRLLAEGDLVVSATLPIDCDLSKDGDTMFDFVTKEEDTSDDTDYTSVLFLIKQMVTESSNFLTENEKIVMSKRYFSGEALRQSRIAELMNVSESRVCQIEKGAIKKLEVSLIKFNPCSNNITTGIILNFSPKKYFVFPDISLSDWKPLVRNIKDAPFLFSVQLILS